MSNPLKQYDLTKINECTHEQQTLFKKYQSLHFELIKLTAQIEIRDDYADDALTWIINRRRNKVMNLIPRKKKIQDEMVNCLAKLTDSGIQLDDFQLIRIRYGEPNR